MHPNQNQLASRWNLTLVALFIATLSGCQTGATPKLGGLFAEKPINFAELVQTSPTVSERLSEHASTPAEKITLLANNSTNVASNSSTVSAVPTDSAVSAHSPNFSSNSHNQDRPKTQSTLAAATTTTPKTPTSKFQLGRSVVRAQSPDGQASYADESAAQPGGVSQTAAQYEDFGNPGAVQDNFAGRSQFPMDYTNTADIDVYLAETQTGTVNFGGAYNSDNGIVGQFVINERNFDIARYPRSFREILDGTAWRGAGQTFRLELQPGAVLERYLVSFTEPYMFGTDYSFSASGYLFDRRYFDWDERRLGGRFAVGRRLTPDISINAGVRLESVTVDNPRVDTSNELNNSLGTSNLFLGNVGLIRDTRDSQVLATEGSYLALTYSQAFGDYDFARGDIDYRRYKLLYERPDGSGRHTLSFGTKAGFSGKSTPIFENYYAGGFSTLRGFDFRGAAPTENGVRVGGEFQWLNSVEYMFPLTADEMIRGVVFCDFGTVESSIELNSENFRVAPGFGFRVNMPGGGMGAPLAFDFAFPVMSADGDEEQVFSFYLGVLR